MATSNTIPTLELEVRKLLRLIRRKQKENLAWRDLSEFKKVLVTLERIVALKRKIFGLESEAFQRAVVDAAECCYDLALTKMQRGHMNHCTTIVKSALRLIPPTAYLHDSNIDAVKCTLFSPVLTKLHNLQGICYQKCEANAAARLELDASLAFATSSAVSAYIQTSLCALLGDRGKTTLALQNGWEAIHCLESMLTEKCKVQKVPTGNSTGDRCRSPFDIRNYDDRDGDDLIDDNGRLSTHHILSMAYFNCGAACELGGSNVLDALRLYRLAMTSALDADRFEEKRMLVDDDAKLPFPVVSSVRSIKSRCVKRGGDRSGFCHSRARPRGRVAAHWRVRSGRRSSRRAFLKEIQTALDRVGNEAVLVDGEEKSTATETYVAGSRPEIEIAREAKPTRRPSTELRDHPILEASPTPILPSVRVVEESKRARGGNYRQKHFRRQEKGNGGGRRRRERRRPLKKKSSSETTHQSRHTATRLPEIATTRANVKRMSETTKRVGTDKKRAPPRVRASDPPDGPYTQPLTCIRQTASSVLSDQTELLATMRALITENAEDSVEEKPNESQPDSGFFLTNTHASEDDRSTTATTTNATKVVRGDRGRRRVGATKRALRSHLLAMRRAVQSLSEDDDDEKDDKGDRCAPGGASSNLTEGELGACYDDDGGDDDDDEDTTNIKTSTFKDADRSRTATTLPAIPSVTQLNVHEENARLIATAPNRVAATREKETSHELSKREGKPLRAFSYKTFSSASKAQRIYGMTPKAVPMWFPQHQDDVVSNFRWLEIGPKTPLVLLRENEILLKHWEAEFGAIDSTARKEDGTKTP